MFHIEFDLMIYSVSYYIDIVQVWVVIMPFEDIAKFDGLSIVYMQQCPGRSIIAKSVAAAVMYQPHCFPRHMNYNVQQPLRSGSLAC